MDAFSILGVSPNSTLDECKKAYRRFCKVNHPDTQIGNEEKFQMGIKAWEEIQRIKTQGTVRRLAHVSLFSFKVK